MPNDASMTPGHTDPAPMTAPKASRPAAPPPKPPGQLLARRTALVAGAFCLAVALAMLFGWFQYQRLTPLEAPSMAELKTELLKTPQDEPLKEQIRAEDLRLRTAHDRYLKLTRRGAWLLLGGMAVFLISIQVATWRRKICVIKQPKQPGADWRALVQATSAVVVLGLLAGAGAWWLVRASPSDLSLASLQGASPTNPSPVLAPAWYPSVAEQQRNWGRFRGWDGCAVSTQTNVPLSWDGKTGAHILWQAPVPAPGYNSPIVWGDRLFISGGNAEKREVFCFDVKTGALLWQRIVEKPPGAPAEAQEVPEQSGVAAATMATDGRRVYAIFATGELAAFTLEGEPAWSKSLAPMKNPYGHAASLLAWQGRLILQLDQGDAEEKLSKLYAFDGETGKIIWQQPRPSPSSWASPIVIEAGGKSQIIVLGIPHVIGYNAPDGKELWRVEGLANEVTPSPVFAGGLLFVVSPSEKLLAIRPDGQGDVTKTAVAWSAEEGIPDVTSPVSNGELVFVISTSGLLTCFDAKTGKKVWEHDFEVECQASPTIVGNRLYLLGQKGLAIVVGAGREFKELARSEIADKFYASPAIAQDRIYLRGTTQLYCIGAKGTPN